MTEAELIRVVVQTWFNGFLAGIIPVVITIGIIFIVDKRCD